MAVFTEAHHDQLPCIGSGIEASQSVIGPLPQSYELNSKGELRVPTTNSYLNTKSTVHFIHIFSVF